METLRPNYEYLTLVPDIVVRVDILTHLTDTSKVHKHLFNHINDGKSFYPDGLEPLLVHSGRKQIGLYTGGWGMGHYCSLYYNLADQKYVFVYTGYDLHGKIEQIKEATNWAEMFDYINQQFLPVIPD
jgi:hypothetical protein